MGVGERHDDHHATKRGAAAGRTSSCAHHRAACCHPEPSPGLRRRALGRFLGGARTAPEEHRGAPAAAPRCCSAEGADFCVLPLPPAWAAGAATWTCRRSIARARPPSAASSPPPSARCWTPARPCRCVQGPAHTHARLPPDCASTSPPEATWRRSADSASPPHHEPSPAHTSNLHSLSAPSPSLTPHSTSR